MDFILFESELMPLIRNKNFYEAIEKVENKLRTQPNSDFHKMIGRNLFHLSTDLNVYLNKFYISAKNKIEGKPNGFINSLFKKSAETGKTLKAISCEMNGITINYDLWFISLFGFSFCNDLEDPDWLADFDYESNQHLVIKGLEDLQKAYQDYIENEKWELETQCDLCEILIYLRLQQLFEKTYNIAKNKNEDWTKIPIFVNGHDSELIYSTQGCS